MMDYGENGYLHSKVNKNDWKLIISGVGINMSWVEKNRTINNRRGDDYSGLESNQMSNSKLKEKSSPILHTFLVSKLSENELMSRIYGQLPLNLWDDYSVSQNLLFWKRYKRGWHLSVITRYNVLEKQERTYTERKCLTSDCHLSGKLLMLSTVSFWNISSLIEEQEKLTNQNFEIAA